MCSFVPARRRFLQGGLGLAGLGLFAGCGRIPSLERQPARVPRVGILQISPEVGTPSENNRAFVDGLSELGFRDGQTVGLEWRYAEGRSERFAELLDELVGLPVDLIATEGPAAIAAAKRATTTIPIIMQVTGDPVGLGLVRSLARPGGNITGLTNLAPELSAKRIQQVKEVLPNATGIAVLWNANNPAKAAEFAEVQAAARMTQLDIHSLDVRALDDLPVAFEIASRRRPDALVLLQDALVTVGSENRARIARFSVANRLPAFAATREVVVEAGCLLGYGASVTDLFRRAATYVAKILAGAQPADLPVEQPTTFDFILNLSVARALGLTIPQSVLQQATEVIQ
jgi:putative ABC transport system substrate-binding protein